MSGEMRIMHSLIECHRCTLRLIANSSVDSPPPQPAQGHIAGLNSNLHYIKMCVLGAESRTVGAVSG